jgi:hypothetical protein
MTLMMARCALRRGQTTSGLQDILTIWRFFDESGRKHTPHAAAPTVADLDVTGPVLSAG